jgi:RND superfamily putative drug exporter
MTVVPDLTAKATPTNIGETIERPSATINGRAAPPVEQTGDRESGVQGRPGVLYRWAAFVATHWRAVLVVWAAVVSACMIAMPAVEKSLKAPDFNVSTAESTEAARILDRHFPTVGAEQNVVVFDFRQGDVDAPASRETILRALSVVRSAHGVAKVGSPFDKTSMPLISGDRRTAIALVGLVGNQSNRSDAAAEISDKLARLSSDAVWMGITGPSPMQTDQIRVSVADTHRAELIGLPVALLLLIFSLGALVSAAIPIVVALAGIAVAYGLIFGLSAFVSFDTLVLAVTAMIGTGVGIDYSMFIVSRFREELTQSDIRDPSARTVAAVATAADTAGRTIVASGVIVMVSLGALIVVDVPLFRAIAGGVAAAVVAALLVALTLLPAMLAGLGSQINFGSLPTRFLPADSRAGHIVGGWQRWAKLVMRRPVMFVTAAVAVLLLAALPLAGVKFGLDAGMQALAAEPSGNANRLIEDKFASGLLAPMQVVMTGPDRGPMTDSQDIQARAFVGSLYHDHRVSYVLPEVDNGRMVATVILNVSIDSPAATELVRSLRADAAKFADDGGPAAHIGGATAQYVDISKEISKKSPLVFGLVLIFSFAFLVVAFRSILLPIKAIVMNLLAIAATMGITVAVFQWGAGESLFDFRSPGFIQVYLPTVVFAVLFGLSMDYEVFLIGRIREYWDRGASNEDAVASGLAHTARPITTAAAIMVAVFASFVTAHVLEHKQIGFGLALAVAIDAVIVRLILVPALMRAFGRWNWWLPKLDMKTNRAPNNGEFSCDSGTGGTRRGGLPAHSST